MCLRFRGSVLLMMRLFGARVASALPLALAGLLLLGLLAVDRLYPRPAMTGDGDMALPSEASPPPELSQGSILVGELVYKEHCAACHGANLEGQPNWKKAGADGKFPSPPHDDSGHTWHHPDDVLKQIILNGGNGNPDAKTNMPAFRGKLTPIQVDGVLDYFKSTWSQQNRDYQWRMTVSGGSMQSVSPP